MEKSYEKAGVNLEAGYEVVRRIKQHVASTNCFGCADPCQACFTGEYPTVRYDDEFNND